MFPLGNFDLFTLLGMCSDCAFGTHGVLLIESAMQAILIILNAREVCSTSEFIKAVVV